MDDSFKNMTSAVETVSSGSSLSEFIGGATSLEAIDDENLGHSPDTPGSIHSSRASSPQPLSNVEGYKGPPRRRRDRSHAASIICQFLDSSGKGIVCKQRAILGFQYCIRHILLDTNAPYKRCEHHRKPKSKKDMSTRCTNAIRKDKEEKYCSTHMIMNGLKEAKRKPAACVEHSEGVSLPSSDLSNLSSAIPSPHSPSRIQTKLSPRQPSTSPTSLATTPMSALHSALAMSPCQLAHVSSVKITSNPIVGSITSPNVLSGIQSTHGTLCSTVSATSLPVPLDTTVNPSTHLLGSDSLSPESVGSTTVQSESSTHSIENVIVHSRSSTTDQTLVLHNINPSHTNVPCMSTTLLTPGSDLSQQPAQTRSMRRHVGSSVLASSTVNAQSLFTMTPGHIAGGNNQVVNQGQRTSITQMQQRLQQFHSNLNIKRHLSPVALAALRAQAALRNRSLLTRFHPYLAARLMDTGPQSRIPIRSQTARSIQPLSWAAPPIRTRSPSSDSEEEKKSLSNKVIRLRQKRQRRRMVGAYRNIADMDTMCRMIEDADFDRTDLFPLGLEPSDDEDVSFISSSVLPSAGFSVFADSGDPSTQLYLVKKQLRLERHGLLSQAQLNAPIMCAAKRFPTSAGAALRQRAEQSTPSKQLAPHTLRRCCQLDSNKQRCDKSCLPMSNHCSLHVLYNVNQRLFSFCTQSFCRRPVNSVDAFLWDGRCQLHRESREEKYGPAPLYECSSYMESIPSSDPSPLGDISQTSPAQCGDLERIDCHLSLDVSHSWDDIEQFLMSEGFPVDSPGSQTTPT